MTREEFEALPGFVRWTGPFDDDVLQEWTPQAAAEPPAAWFQPAFAGWRLPTDVERSRRCSTMRCGSHDIVATIVRSRRGGRGTTSTHVHCAEHVASYGMRVVDGELLWLRWLP
jgi:hypothetical protein